jgi:hypothetical protein
MTSLLHSPIVVNFGEVYPLSEPQLPYLQFFKDIPSKDDE